MGGTTSKVENEVTSISRDITNITNSAISNNFTTVKQENIITIGSGCTLKGTKISQKNTVSVNIKAMQEMKSINDMSSQITNDLAQAAELQKQSFSLKFGDNDLVNNNANIFNDIYTEITNEAVMNCFLDVVQTNIVDMLPNCELDNVQLEQENLATLMSECVNKAAFGNTKLTDLMNSVSQDASSAEEGVLSGLLGGPFVMIAIVAVVAFLGYNFILKSD